jgi:hypothetical protein
MPSKSTLADARSKTIIYGGIRITFIQSKVRPTLCSMDNDRFSFVWLIGRQGLTITVTFKHL